MMAAYNNTSAFAVAGTSVRAPDANTPTSVTAEDCPSDSGKQPRNLSRIVIGSGIGLDGTEASYPIVASTAIGPLLAVS